MKKLISGVAIAALFLSACNNKSATTSSAADSAAIVSARNKTTAMNSDLAFIKHDVDGATKDYAPGFTELGNGADKPAKNLDSIKMGLKQFFAAFPDLKGENLHAVAQGDSVIITGTYSGTFTGAFMKIKPTKKMFKAPDADIYTFNKDGKITSHSNIQSDATYFYQLGIPMPPKKK